MHLAAWNPEILRVLEGFAGFRTVKYGGCKSEYFGFILFVLRILLVLRLLDCPYSQYLHHLGLQYCSYPQYPRYFGGQYCNTVFCNQGNKSTYPVAGISEPIFSKTRRAQNIKKKMAALEGSRRGVSISPSLGVFALSPLSTNSAWKFVQGVVLSCHLGVIRYSQYFQYSQYENVLDTPEYASSVMYVDLGASVFGVPEAHSIVFYTSVNMSWQIISRRLRSC